MSSGFSLMSPRFFAVFTQFPSVPSLIPRSRAISAIGRPELIANSTASALYSAVNFRRVDPTSVFLLVDHRATSVTVYGSGSPPDPSAIVVRESGEAERLIAEGGGQLDEVAGEIVHHTE